MLLLPSLGGEEGTDIEPLEMKDSVEEFESRCLRCRRRSCSSISERMENRSVFEGEVWERTSGPVSGDPSVNLDARGADVGDGGDGGDGVDGAFGRDVAMEVDILLV